MLVKTIKSISPANYLVFLLQEKLVAYQVYSDLLAPFVKGSSVEYKIYANSSLTDLFFRLGKEFKPKIDDKWFLGLPLRYFSIVNFSLPRAAEENLEQAARYALMRHVPFDLSSAYVNYHPTFHDESIEIAAIVAQKDLLEPILQSVSESGINLTSIFPSLAFWAVTNDTDGVYFTEDSTSKEMLVCQDKKIYLQLWDTTLDSKAEDEFFKQSKSLLKNMTALPSTLFVWEGQITAADIQERINISFKQSKQLSEIPSSKLKGLTSTPYSINLVSKSILKQKKIASILQLAGIIFFCLSFFAIPLSNIAGKRAYLDRIEEKISKIKVQANTLEDLRVKNKETVEYLAGLVDQFKSKPIAIEILREVTEVLPETAWLYSLSYSDLQINLEGEARSATALIEALENSPLFQEVHFDSPVKKYGSKDRFKIVAKVAKHD